MGNGGILLRFIPTTEEWIETSFLALSCLEAILANKENNNAKVSLEFLLVIQNIAVDMVSSTSYESQNKQHYNKVRFTDLQMFMINLKGNITSSYVN